MNSAKTYIFYEGWNGEPKSQWQYWNKPKVPGCIVNYIGNCYAPEFRWVAAAYSVNQGALMVHNSETSASRGDGLGIWWDREVHKTPPPLGADPTIYYALVAHCRTPTMTLWATREEALRCKARLDQSGCGGCCYRDHVITPMKLAEAERSSPRWAWWTKEFGDDD